MHLLPRSHTAAVMGCRVRGPPAGIEETRLSLDPARGAASRTAFLDAAPEFERRRLYTMQPARLEECMPASLTEDDLSFTLVAGLCAEAIDDRLRRTCRVTDLGNRATAFYLADLHTRGLHQALGMPSSVAYAVRSLGMSRRTARELLNVGLRLRELRVIDAAFAESRLSWSRVRRLCDVATPQTESAWMEKALVATQDELDRLVRRARPGDAPPDGTGMPQARFGLHFELDAVDWQMWENARAKLRAECGDDAELRDVDILKEMLRLVLASDAEGRVPGRKAVEGGPFRVLVRDDALVTEDGEEPIAPPAADSLSSDATTPPAMRATVFARDGNACVHCRSRRGLHAHHVHWRSKGGPTTPGNLVTLCARCHSLVHENFLDVEVAQCAGGRTTPSFVFRDANGRRLERRVILGVRPLAQSTTAGGEAPAFDSRWVAAHLDWFDDRGGRLILRPRFQSRFAAIFGSTPEANVTATSLGGDRRR